MHAVYLCYFCPFSPSVDREPQKSFYIFLPSIVSPYSSNPFQSCTWARTLKSLNLLRGLCTPTMSKRQNSLCMFFAPFVVLPCFARLCQSLLRVPLRSWFDLCALRSLMASGRYRALYENFLHRR